MNKKRRGIEYIPVRYLLHWFGETTRSSCADYFKLVNPDLNLCFSKAGVTAVDLVKLFGSKSSVIR